jgi:hypothetical protein
MRWRSRNDPGAPPAEPRTSRSWTVAQRLVAWYAATAFVLVFAATAILYVGLGREFRGGDERRLLGRVQLLQSILRHSDNMLAELKWEVELEQDESGDDHLKHTAWRNSFRLRRFRRRPPAPARVVAASNSLPGVSFA